MRGRAVVLAVLLVVSATITPVVSPGFAAGGDDNEAPLADAGLDQSVERGTTVYLDGSGSRDPDGNVTEYDWTIRTPTGDKTRPACGSCAQTRFTPSAVGTYEVTVQVTDDDGATASDTLFVRVEPGAAPSISVSGPTTTMVGSSLTYTVEVGAGTASLVDVTWRVDGDVVRTEAVSGGQRTFAFPYSFAAAGDHDITATVSDADGLSASDALTVAVEGENTSDGGGGGNESPDDGSPGDGGSGQSIAEQASSVVVGPQLLTGEAPFTASYQLQVDTDEVMAVEWWRDGHRAGTGESIDVAWTPGRHTLYAVVEYTDGSTDMAQFAEGGSEVAVDPEPKVELAGLESTGRISGSVESTDAFGNLRELSVTVDGEEVASKAVDPVETRTGDAGRQLALSFDHGDVDPGEHTVEVQARDARGQVVEYTESIEVVGEPEVVSAKFVNGPVDSYHSRIDPERYTAKHVLTVDLNGVDPDNLDDSYTSRGLERVGSDWKEVMYREASDELILESYWSGDEPEVYTLGVTLELVESESSWSERALSSLQITPSPPEVRVDVTYDGTPENNKDSWGLVVDLSDSFDPDGSSLTFSWQGRLHSISADNTTARLDSFNANSVVIEDDYNKSDSLSLIGFLEYYTPQVSEVSEVTEGPYKPNETIRFDVTTELYELPKPTYYASTELDLRISNADGHVENWGCGMYGPYDESIIDQHDWDCQVVSDTRNQSKRHHQYHTGTVTFEASEFLDDDQPTVSIVNIALPNRSAREINLPEVTVLEKGERVVSDAEVEETSYLVEQPEILRQEAVTEQQRDALLADDFSVKRTEESGTKYTLERREQVQKAKYETETQTFDTRGARSAFLNLNPEWEPAGEESELRNYTTTETEWRSSKGGTGEFTGETREVKVEGAEYRTERKYRYTTTVERTGTREVTRKRTVTVPVTRYRTVERCNQWGCVMVEESYTVWETKTETYTVTQEYTYTTTETSTYWAAGKRHADHTYTGQSRRIETDPPEYDTQYQYEYEQTREEWVYSYTARHREQVREAKYEWQSHRTTRSEVDAETAAMDPDVRIASEEPAKIWILTKQTRTTRIWKDAHPHPSDIVETEAMLNLTVAQEYIYPDGDVVSEQQDPRFDAYVFDGYLTTDEIISEINGTEVAA